MYSNLLESDLNYIFEHTVSLWEELRNQRIFITGGTGFFGRWLLESFCWINKKLMLNAKAVILTRNKRSFLKENFYIVNDEALDFYEGNVIDFQFPVENFHCIIHAAAAAGVQFEKNSDFVTLETIVTGTKNTLDFANKCKAKKILFISSGAVYRVNAEIPFFLEEKPLKFDPLNCKSTYAMGKLIAENICNLYAQQYLLSIKIARCFSFVGPYLPLNAHFAIGNFILNRLKDEDIIIKGDGTPYRAYLYAADLCIWLWTILFRGESITPYNVGSDEAYSILEIAILVSNSMPSKISIKLMETPVKGNLPERYVPDITRARERLKLFPRIRLVDAINKTINWYLLANK